jgi:hypothetical protein
MPKREDYRSPEGRYPTAKDIADRLYPDLDMNELLLWSPNLFAYTSYILSVTSAYQLVISPPSGKSWAPKNHEIKKWLEPKVARVNLESWINFLAEEWSVTDFDTKSKVDEVVKEIEESLNKVPKQKKGKNTLATLLIKDDPTTWTSLVQVVGDEWVDKLSGISNEDLKLIDDKDQTIELKQREQKLFEIIFKRSPAILLACWSHFYNEVTDVNFYKDETKKRKFLRISDLLCNSDISSNQDEEAPQLTTIQLDRSWIVAQTLITMHAIADTACVKWGFHAIAKEDASKNAQKYAEKLLFERGTLSTINPERCRVLPKRHNPMIGITLRSISSNLAFHRSSVEVVWRKSAENRLASKLKETSKKNVELKNTTEKNVSILLVPYPLTVKAKDFKEYVRESPEEVSVNLSDGFGFFHYDPEDEIGFINEIGKLIKKGNEEIGEGVDIVVLPESSLNSNRETNFEDQLVDIGKTTEYLSPSVYIAGFRETITEIAEQKDVEPKEVSFPRNAVYCKDYNPDTKGKKYGENNNDTKFKGTPKYKQYKHHRWRLDESQIKQYGLSQVLDRKKIWWEAIKIPRRRVSFLNVGDKLTICHLICEDFARQDPIADLIRQVGPSLVVTILMDGPQRADRWSSRYASVLSEDPGSSVITLTSYGMMKRWNSPFKPMSKVIALWSESHSFTREIVLEDGAKAVLLTLEIDEVTEKTADGREESESTAVLKLVDVIQIYLDDKK